MKNISIEAILATCIIASLILIVHAASNPFNPVSLSFKTDGSEVVVAYYDVNRDSIIDVITKSASQLNTFPHQLNIYLWDDAQQNYQNALSLNVSASELVLLPTQLIPNETTLFLSLKSVSETGNVTISTQMIEIVCTDLICVATPGLTIPQLNSIDNVEPTLITLQGSPALIVSRAGLSTAIKFALTYVDKAGDGTTFTPVLSYSVAYLSQFIDNGVDTINSFQSIWSGDWSGDCFVDMVILKANPQNKSQSVLQFIRGDSYQNFYYVKSAVVRSKVTHLALDDINFDSHIDLVLLIATGILEIHYNKDGASSSAMTSLPAFCSSSFTLTSEIPFDFSLFDNGTLSWIQQIELGLAAWPSGTLLLGDYDRDGFNDLTVQLINGVGQPVSRLYRNSPCQGSECGTYNQLLINQSTTLNLRTFTYINILSSSITTSLSYKISFLDIYSDGVLDLILSTYGVDSLNYPFYRIVPLINTAHYDAFFMSITILEEVKGMNTLANGRNSIGASAAFYVTSLTGTYLPKIAVQLSQPGNALQLPYIYCGLGRTNNYVQILTITLPATNVLSHSWTPIIPNSQIITLPPVSSKDINTSSTYQTKEWTLKVMIEPTERMKWVSLLVIAMLIVVGIAIWRITAKEKEQDKETIEDFYRILR